MTIKLTEWQVPATTAAEILGIPVETFRTWRKRHGLLPSGEWLGSGRRPAMNFQFRHLLQAVCAQKLMGVGIPADAACTAPDAGLFQAYVNGEEVRFAFTGGKLQETGSLLRDVWLTFSLEVEGEEIAKALAADIAAARGQDEAATAYSDFAAFLTAQRNQRDER